MREKKRERTKEREADREGRKVGAQSIQLKREPGDQLGAGGAEAAVRATEGQGFPEANAPQGKRSHTQNVFVFLQFRVSVKHFSLHSFPVEKVIYLSKH